MSSNIRPAYRSVPQLLAAAEKDTDAASVFYNGTSPADYNSAILVVKGRENVEYVVSVLTRQSLVTPGKPVEGNGDEAEQRSKCIGEPIASGVEVPSPALDMRHIEEVQRLHGQFGVAVALLRECVDPLEVSAAVIESEDGGASIDALIAQLRGFLAAVDHSKAGPQR